MGFFTNLAAEGAANDQPFNQDQRELTGLASGDAFEDFGVVDALFDPGNFRSGDFGEIAGRHGLSELLGFTQADAARQAAEDLKAATQEGQRRVAAGTERQLGTIGQTTDLAQQQLREGFGGAGEELRGGLGAQQRLLQQAQGQFGTTAGLVDPALQSLQGTSTAAGRSSALQQIMADPNNAILFDQLNRQRQNEASSLGIRRSGANLAAGESQRFGLANQLLSGQESAQQNLLNTGLGGQGATANILQQRAAAAGAGGGALSQLLQSRGTQQANLTERGGLTIADIINRGTQADVDLLGQFAQAQAAGTTGAGNAFTEGAGRGLEAVGTLFSAFSDPSLKTDVVRTGEYQGIPTYTWNWNDKALDMYGLKGDSFGHMANEIEKVHPHLVHRDKNDIMKVDYSTHETVSVI